MIVNVDLEKLQKLNLSPNEYVYLILKKNKTYIDIRNPVIEKKLKDRGFISENGEIYIDEDTNNDWINDWLSLWPKGVLKATRYPVAGNEKEVKKRMSKFILEYPEYTPDIIMSATKKYLEERSKENWKYTHKNIKFIKDRETGSELARWCENLNHVENLEDNNTFI